MRLAALLSVFLLVQSCSGPRVVRFDPVEPLCFQNPMLPLTILEHFARNFPEATPYWGVEGRNYSLRYIDPATSLGHVVIYDRFGTILRNEDQLTLSQCPRALKEYCLRHCANTPVSVWSCVTGENEPRYYLQKGSRRIWFDKDGSRHRKKVVLNINTDIL